MIERSTQNVVAQPDAPWLRAAGKPCRAWWVMALLLLAAPGCQNFVNPISRWRAAYDDKLFRHLSPEETADVSGDPNSTNLMQRWLSPRPNMTVPGRNNPSTLIMGSNGWRPITKPPANPKADAELKAARALFNAGKYPEAEKAFAQIVKDRKGTPWGFEARFGLAETQFQRKNYVAAHDSYETLHAEDPATDHLDKIVSREYAIARIWFAQGDPKTPSSERIPWTGRFDGRLPFFDTQGSALKALEHVRHNDPTGELADDAALEIATFHLKHRDFESASIYFDQFMKDHAKSPYLLQAEQLAIESRMKSYQGPEYDASVLEEARKLVRKSLTEFPEQDTREKLFHTLDVINEEEAKKTYQDGIYYKQIGKPASAEFYLSKIPLRWPNSPWAVKAKTELIALAKMPRKPSKPSRIMISPGANDPYFSNGGMGGMGGMMGGMPMMGMGGPGMM